MSTASRPWNKPEAEPRSPAPSDRPWLQSKTNGASAPQDEAPTPKLNGAGHLPAIDSDAIRAHIKMLHTLAAAADVTGVLLLVRFEGENNAPKIERFGIGGRNVEFMVKMAIAWAANPNVNLYAPWAILRPDLEANKKGKEIDVVVVLAFVGDLDADTGMAGGPLPVDAPYILETSAGNFQPVFPLARAMPPKDAKPLAEALADAIRCDHGTKDINHVWRIPGTLNWPTENKLERGRPAEPPLVKVSTPWTGGLVEVEKLREALAGSTRPAAAPKESPFSQERTGETNVYVEELISAPVTAKMDRSGQFYAAVCAAVENGMTAADLEALMREYPDGCAEKYLEPRDRLREEIARAWEKRAVELAQADATVTEFVEGRAEQRKEAPGAKQPNDKKKSRIRLVPFDEIRLSTERRDLIKGLIPRAGLTIVWGPPKCGKSFWLFDCLMHVVLGWDYRGKRVHQGPGVYCAFEGQKGFEARAVAFRLNHLSDHTDAVPFYLVPVTLDLVKDHKALISAISEQLGQQQPTCVALDTLNRSLVGSESSDEDMAAYIKAADAIREAFDCAVIIVHHCGVEASRPRGHTSLTGAADAQLRVERDAAHNVIVTVEWMKDGAEGDVIASALETVEVGMDEDGEPISSCVVMPASAGKPERKLSGAVRVALEVLRMAIDEAGSIPPASEHLPKNTRTISVELWRTYTYQSSITESDKPDTRQKAFARAANQLKSANLIGKWGDYVWLTSQAGQAGHTPDISEIVRRH